MPTKTIERPIAAVTERKPPVVLIDPKAPSAPEVRALLGDVESRLKLSFAMAAAGHKPANPTAADTLFQKIVASRSPAVRAKAAAKAQSMLAGPTATRQNFFGRFAAIDPNAYEGLDAAHAKLGLAAVDGGKLKSALEAFGNNDAALSEAAPGEYSRAGKLVSIDLDKLRKMKVADPDVVAGAKYKKLGLFINKVHCYDETDGWGSDEIAMGGTATDPSGATHKIAQFMVSDDFDAGESKTYAGKGKLFREWTLVRTGAWPQTYAAILCMAEKDGSGFGDFLTELWEKVGDEVKKAIAGAVGGAIGAALGSVFGPLGTAVGFATGWLLGLLVDFILGAFQDDIVACHTVMLVLGAATKSYYDWAHLTDNPANQFTMNYKGDGGYYRVWCSLSVYP